MLETLRSHYEGTAAPTALQSTSRLEDPFRVLIATVLSQRTRDEETEIAEDRLFDAYHTAADLASAGLADIEKRIRNVGFYRTKAKAVKSIAGIVASDYGGHVPSDMESLLGLPMVGRKTANCVLVYGFGRPAIPVDTHVHRIANRLGWVRTKTPEETETALSSLLPEGSWLLLNELMVTHGKNICRPVSPMCGDCPVRNLCVHGSGHSMPNAAAGAASGRRP